MSLETSSAPRPVHRPEVAQDPDERFDLVTAAGTPLGTSKRRADVHRDGDWHRSIHVWIYGILDNEPFLLFQRRGFDKDTWPGVLDATAAGHLAAGEDVPDAFREIEEELGIAPAPDRLRWIGTRVCANEQAPATLDRELQEVFLLREDAPLTAYGPSPAEVAALVRLPLAATLEFLGGFRDRVAGESLCVQSGAIAAVTITADDFVPTIIDRYYYRIAIAIAAVLRGDRHIAV
ncbi:MAG TPA: NUDIX domain-containing protein [Thermomicrobiales bacterium]|nr:NUDIX domain-containing protein [Thermomicrobiales bacterium]